MSETTNTTQVQENAAAAAEANKFASGISNNMTADQKIDFMVKNMGLTTAEAKAVVSNQSAGVMTSVYNINGQYYTKSQLETLGFSVSNLQPEKVVKDTEATGKGGIFDNIPDWLVTAAKVMLGIVVVVGGAIVLYKFVIAPRFLGDKTVTYNGEEIDDVEF